MHTKLHRIRTGFTAKCVHSTCTAIAFHVLDNGSFHPYGHLFPEARCQANPADSLITNRLFILRNLEADDILVQQQTISEMS